MAKIRLKHYIYIALCFSGISLATLLFFGVSALFGFRLWQKEWTPQGKTDLQFEQVVVAFQHQADLENSLPFLAAAAIDVDGDGIDEVFLGGGKNQQDALMKFDGKGFIDIGPGLLPEKQAGDATMGAASLDLEKDGLADLIVARESGLWLIDNSADGLHTEKLPIELAENTTPLSIAFGDINKDGWADIYVSGYLKIDQVEGETIFSDGYGGYSYLLMNEGDNSWRDATKEAGLYRQHNTFTALFVDLDNDHDSDLVIAQDTGVVEMYENTGRLPMRPVQNPTVSSYPMGIAAGDYDNDGLVDLFFSNVGYTLPPALLRGDLPKDAPFNPEYMLLHNEGSLRFEDVARQHNAAKYGFGWGVVSADMNLDGYEDLLAAQNYARFPANDLLEHYPGKLLQFDPKENVFHPVEKTASIENRFFGIAPIISDFNNDGAPDLFWANLDDRSTAYISKGAVHNWIKVRLPNNALALNAIVTIGLEDGTRRTKQLMTSQGLSSDQGRELIFGLGDETGIEFLTVDYQNGQHDMIRAPSINRTFEFTEQ